MAAPPAFDLAALDRASTVSIGTEIAPHADPGLDPQAVISGASGLPFASPLAGVSQNKRNAGDIWIRYRLTNSSSEPQAAKFVMPYAYLERVDLFEVLPGGGLRVSTAGSATPISGGAVATAYPTFQMMLSPAETRDYYVRVRGNGLLFLPVQIASESRFSQDITRDTLVWSLIVGTALAFALHAASMSFGPSRGAWRAYLCFSLSAAGYTLLSSGLVNALVPPGLMVNPSMLIGASQALLIAFGTLFITRFLDLRRAAPRLYLLLLMMAGFAALTVISLVLPRWLALLSNLIATGLGAVILMAGLGWLTYRRVAGARSLLMACVPCFLATVWMYLRLFNVTPYLPLSNFIVPLTFAFTLAHLSGILGGRAKEAELWANNDMLTGLGNRRLLTALLELEAREPTRRYGAAIAIDLDKFKDVNDRLGHAAGDAVLVAVGERLRATFKGKGDVFRLGGDEFLILCYASLGRLEVISLAGDYLHANRQPVCFEEQMLVIDASIGVAFRAGHTGLDAMMKQADRELYAVKQAGRGMVRIADQRAHDRRKTRRGLAFMTAPGTFFARTAERPPEPANDTDTAGRAKG